MRSTTRYLMLLGVATALGLPMRGLAPAWGQPPVAGYPTRTGQAPDPASTGIPSSIPPAASVPITHPTWKPQVIAVSRPVAPDGPGNPSGADGPGPTLRLNPLPGQSGSRGTPTPMPALDPGSQAPVRVIASPRPAGAETTPGVRKPADDNLLPTSGLRRAADATPHANWRRPPARSSAWKRPSHRPLPPPSPLPMRSPYATPVRPPPWPSTSRSNCPPPPGSSRPSPERKAAIRRSLGNSAAYPLGVKPASRSRFKCPLTGSSSPRRCARPPRRLSAGRS